MPGSVINAAPATVLPQSLCRTFVNERSYPLIENEYKNGESQRSVQAVNSRKRWRMAKRLTAAQLGELRDFYEARGGALEAFYFYDPYETNPRFSCDPTGAETTGRHTVRFDSNWSQSVDIGRTNVEIMLVELA